MLVARRYLVYGRVQRVGFRVFVEDAGRREGMRGHVRNQHDGSVEILAEGDLESMLRFEQALRRGPAGARVVNLETTELEPSSCFTSFIVTG